LIDFAAEDVLVGALNTLQAASQESNNWELTKLQLVEFSFVIVSQLHDCLADVLQRASISALFLVGKVPLQLFRLCLMNLYQCVDLLLEILKKWTENFVKIVDLILQHYLDGKTGWFNGIKFNSWL
jgi:hypothetical protein